MTDSTRDGKPTMPELLRQAIRESGGTIPGDDGTPPQESPSGPPKLRIVKDEEDPPVN